LSILFMVCIQENIGVTSLPALSYWFFLGLFAVLMYRVNSLVNAFHDGVSRLAGVVQQGSDGD